MEVNALSLISIDILLNKSSLVFNFVAKTTCVKIRVTNKLLASKDRGVKGSFGNRIECIVHLTQILLSFFYSEQKLHRIKWKMAGFASLSFFFLHFFLMHEQKIQNFPLPPTLTTCLALIL